MEGYCRQTNDLFDPNTGINSGYFAFQKFKERLGALSSQAAGRWLN